MSLKRCPWADPSKPLDLDYHDEEWGVPVTNDSALFEQLTLEGAQAGLSWSAVLGKRECYRILFNQFSIGKVGRLTSRDVDVFMKNPGIIRHRGKLESVVCNARFFADIQSTHGSFYNYVLGVVNDLSLDDSATVLSERLKLLGFSFVGPTIVESFLLAAGFWNGHSGDCFRRSEIEALRPL
jgi:DNA-3-methyladenine glycosylase I